MLLLPQGLSTRLLTASSTMLGNLEGLPGVSDAAASPPMDIYFMIPDATASHVLLLQGAGGWALPHQRPDDPSRVSPQTIHAYLRDQLGADCTVLQVARFHCAGEPQPRFDFYYALESHGPTGLPPPGARWTAPDELEVLGLDPVAREAITIWLAEETSGHISPERPAWARRGWLDEVTAWTSAELARHDLALAGPLEQVKTWGISCLLRGYTAAGVVYVKGAATLPHFTNEPAVTATLAGLFPRNVPHIISVDTARRWLITTDFGGAPLHNVGPQEWAATVSVYGTLQRERLAHVPELFAAGMLDRRLAQLDAGLEPLVHESQDFHLLSDEDKDSLAAAAPRLHDACASLAAYGIPDTLVHGDLPSANIHVKDGVPIYFDWSDACIAHPFLDLASLLEPDWLGADLDRAQLVDLYLEGWSAYAPLPRRREAARQAVLLGALHQAISYQHIVLSLEPVARRGLDAGWRFWGRRTLSALGASNHKQSAESQS
jgi:hypothetical protein